MRHVHSEMMRVCEEEAYCSSEADMGTTPACVAEKPDDDNCSRNEVDAAWSWLREQVEYEGGGGRSSMRGGEKTWRLAHLWYCRSMAVS
jgi:hypothetical protein